MRLWSLHPRYLDPQGLVALWRETLLARKVLRGETRGYRHHPQLQRFREARDPLAAIDAYLAAVQAEATARGYAFDPSKFDASARAEPIAVARGQLKHEWSHLMCKLEVRSPELHARWRDLQRPRAHPSFRVVPGGVADWERAG
ncbi:DNA lyase [Pseudoluteimonas lycopersici]|uniref:DNA lyase n=1 Tax=Pseudoluteimonas lycopersici TaxID=1324796 RepID=A0A516V6B6_9GAMM|nr:pyrimidine dimer DNA glycosylase/endonuclease V [Lysobacter lycopersici]QDQ74031.1 DNA lyase [Lysobacter lycopersici]